ncbi:MAG: helix-turn-helix domain-containing protein [Prolixibacteraceae bacterium]|jgi:transcriptional regulator with XRE-family HTH domain|nr:helix-turn-helix domain-containing protein [Prolixibacteraceae bacterium]
MKDRIIQFLVSEKISPAEFADKIGVQRSSMSHILNGRNYPSASFIQKMLQVYPYLNSRWLLIGDGEMNLGFSGVQSSPVYSEPIQSREEPLLIQPPVFQPQPQEPVEPDLFNNSVPETKGDPHSATIPIAGVNNPVGVPVNENFQQIPDGSKLDQVINKYTINQDVINNAKEIEQILFFYKDKTFNVYRPS